MTHTLAELDQIVGGLTEQMNDKLDLPEGLSQAGVDYVIDFKAPTADDPSWYRIYKSGWIEQGGRYGSSSSYIAADTTITVPLPRQMASTNFHLVNMYGGRSGTSSVTNAGAAVEVIANRTTTSVAFNTDGIYSSFCNYIYFEVKGIAAST